MKTTEKFRQPKKSYYEIFILSILIILMSFMNITRPTILVIGLLSLAYWFFVKVWREENLEYYIKETKIVKKKEWKNVKLTS